MVYVNTCYSGAVIVISELGVKRLTASSSKLDIRLSGNADTRPRVVILLGY